MIVATRPDPTVRPPSRYQNGVLWGVNGYFSYVLCGKIWIFHCVRVVFGDFVIIVLSLYPRISIQFTSLKLSNFSLRKDIFPYIISENPIVPLSSMEIH